MGWKKVNKNAKSIKLNSKSDREFFLIHGYTGSPSDFRNLPKILHKEFDANVNAIRLIGHGTNIRDLDGLKYQDFMKPIEKEFLKDLKKGRKIVVGGLSLGGIMALELASKYPTKGIFVISAPYYMKFPFTLITIIEPFLPWKYWRKSVSNYELQMREGSFHYPHIHSRGLTVVREFKKNFLNVLKNVRVPCLNIHSRFDYLTHPRSADFIKENIASKRIKNIIYVNKDVHNLFFSEVKDKMFDDIVNFFRENKIFEK